MFNIEIKKIESKGRISHYILINLTKGTVNLEIVHFGETFDVIRTVNNKRSVLSSPMGKIFWSWEDVQNHYKQFTGIIKENTESVLNYTEKLKDKKLEYTLINLLQYSK